MEFFLLRRRFLLTESAMGALSIVPFAFGDSASDFASFASETNAFFFDSSLFDSATGRFSFWGVKPTSVLQTESGFITRDGHTQIHSPVEAFKELLQEVNQFPTDPYIPFTGGLAGFLSYEWGLQLEEIAPKESRSPNIPDSWWGVYPTVVGYDHMERVAWVSSIESEEKANQWVEVILHNRQVQEEKWFATIEESTSPDYQTSLSKKNYEEAFAKIQKHLQAGDCYQINLTQQFSVPVRENAWGIYQRLRKTSPAPYACYFNLGSFQILSSSPECFLQSSGDGTITTRPIKGTRKRGADVDEDRRLLQELQYSEKDHAELLMITDLERNDFGKICEPGSVEVLQLNQPESFAQVHHLISVVRGKLKSTADIADAIVAMMPGGSITGAPKRRAMQIIEELEPTARGLYTGAIGWLGAQNRAHLNIAIRTMIVQESVAYFNAGSGVVIDSRQEEEYEEILAKAKGMMESLQS